MEKLSRVKKYEQLRKSIEMENLVNNPNADELHQEQEHAFKQFDSSVLKKSIIAQEPNPVREKKEYVKPPRPKYNEDTFTNEYLDDFIREVREYNIRKGLRECEDTQIDILSQLSDTNRIKRGKYVQPIEEEVVDHTHENLSESVLHLVQECEEEEEESLEPTTTPSMDEMLVALEKTSEAMHLKQAIVEEEASQEHVQEQEDDYGYDERQEEFNQKLIEQTQQMKVQMDEYEEELSGLSDGVEKNNRILNLVLTFLIIILFLLIAYIGYYIWKGGAF